MAKPEAISPKAAPEEQDMRRVCTMDVKQCSDGSYVSRDSSAGCAFRACSK